MDPTGVLIHLKTITVGERIWGYRVAGDGDQTIIVLPGALGSGDLLVQHISGLLSGMRIVVPEYSPAKSISEFVNAFDAVVSIENIEMPIVYGGSFGGLLAQCWTRKYPDRFRSLILSGSGYPDPRRIPKNKGMLKILPFIPISGMRLLMKIAAKRITRAIPSNGNIWYEELQKLASNIQREDLASRYHTAIDFDRNFKFSPEDLKELRILLLEGTLDRVANNKMRTRMRSLYPHAVLSSIEGAGHSLLLSHPEEWKLAMVKFTEETRSLGF